MEATKIPFPHLESARGIPVVVVGVPGDAPGSGDGISIGFEVKIPGYPRAIYEPEVWVAGLDGAAIEEAIAIAKGLAAEDED